MGDRSPCTTRPPSLGTYDTYGTYNTCNLNYFGKETKTKTNTCT